MSNKAYIIIKDFRTPYVTATGMPHKPTRINFKYFKKGQIIKGELKTANGKPAFILVAGTLMVPLAMVKEVVTKDVVLSSATGDQKTDQPKKLTVKDSKVKYLDAMIVGALVAGIGTYIVEKKGWITITDPKMKYYMAGAGAALAAYLVYRNKNKK